MTHPGQPTPHLGCDPGASYYYLEDVDINHIPWVASVCTQQGKLLPERANSFTQESGTVMGGASDLNVPKGIIHRKAAGAAYPCGLMGSLFAYVFR